MERVTGFPNKVLPGGYVFGHTAQRDPEFGFQDEVDLVQVDWEGNIVWKFNRLEHIEDPGHARSGWLELIMITNVKEILSGTMRQD